MKRRVNERPRRYYSYMIEAEIGDVWYRVLRYVNSFKKGYGFSEEELEKSFKKSEHNLVFSFIHDIRAAGYIGVSATLRSVRYIKLHDVPYHISREKFEKNNKGDMLWIESEVVFKKE